MRRYLSYALLSICVVFSTFAGEDPNLTRGIAPANKYKNFDIDTINQFNGNLVIRIPIGDPLPVGPFLSQELMLSYNSHNYDYEFLEWTNDPNESHYKRRAIPEDFSNAGLGWSLTLGRLVPPKDIPWTTNDRGWLYRSPDGSEHAFTTGLGDVVQAETWDGSYLRLKRYPSNLNQAVEYREIEFPDGTVRRFDPSNNLTWIKDRFGNAIEIDYSSLQWLIRNTYGGQTFRTTTINFQIRTAPSGYSYIDRPNFQKVVSSVVIPTFNGAATYSFTYGDTVLPMDGCGDPISFDPSTFAAPLLTEIQMPEGWSYVPTYQTALGDACTAGVIKSMRLPTLGTIEWTHQAYSLPQAECDDNHFWLVEYPGVKTRTLKDAAGNVVGDWTYTQSVPTTPGTNWICHGVTLAVGAPPSESKTTVTSREMVDGELELVGGKTEHYFSAALNWTLYGNRVLEYGLPFTGNTSDVTNGSRFLSTKRFDETNTIVRSTWLTYEGDGNKDGRLANARVKGELTRFNADSASGQAENEACIVDTDRTNYAGYGHYRQSDTTSNFGPARTTYANYTPNATTWVLGTYDSSWVKEAGVARKQPFTFDANGIMKTRRTLAGTAPEAAGIPLADQDVLEAYCRDSRGFMKYERSFGGDGGGVGPMPTDPCSDSEVPTTTEYQIEHAFTFNANNGLTNIRRNIGTCRSSVSMKTSM